MSGFIVALTYSYWSTLLVTVTLIKNSFIDKFLSTLLIFEFHSFKHYTVLYSIQLLLLLNLKTFIYLLTIVKMSTINIVGVKGGCLPWSLWGGGVSRSLPVSRNQVIWSLFTWYRNTGKLQLKLSKTNNTVLTTCTCKTSFSITKQLSDPG